MGVAMPVIVAVVMGVIVRGGQQQLQTFPRRNL
jgi:hypothetical protein